MKDEKAKNQMELGVYAIYDKKAEKFDVPFFAPNDIFAKRRFHLLAEEQGTMISRWTSDFALYEVSKFNPLMGVPENNLVLDGKEIKK